MDETLHPYRITAYSEWEILNVEAQCRDDDHAAAKARRYGSLRHINRNLPSVIFSHVERLAPDGPQPVGTWEYRLRGNKEAIGMRWHQGAWGARPDATDKAALRRWLNED